MQTVLIVGAGKSSSFLIDYMLDNAKQRWKVIVMDSNIEAVSEKLAGHPKGEAAIIDIHDEAARQKIVQQSDIVLSVMPPHLHILLAKDCLKFGKHLITSSYVSDDIKAMHEEVKKAGLLFMCEMGLDPGIDHMSANAIIHSVQRIAGSIHSFKSYCGGLVAPESDDNPWHYKISWNPRNIVLAGKQGATWLENGKQMTAAHEQLFTGARKIKVTNNELGALSYYPNRDSLKYLDLYDLPDVKTFLRATLRHPNFMKGWEAIVKAGMTNEEDRFDIVPATYADWTALKVNAAGKENLKGAFAAATGSDDKVMKQVEWLGIFDNRPVYGENMHTSADILQQLLEDKWKMRAMDKDMVVMQHEIIYERKKTMIKLVSSMVVIGDNRQHSAMAKTVGLPMAILAKRILTEGNIKGLAGVQIPVMPEVYVPVLKELKKYNVEFIEEIE